MKRNGFSRPGKAICMPPRPAKRERERNTFRHMLPVHLIREAIRLAPESSFGARINSRTAATGRGARQRLRLRATAGG